MATAQASNHLGQQARLRNTAADRGPGAPGPGPSVLRALAVGGRRLLGAVLLLLGIAMTSTLLLLPVGLPLALLAVALIAAPDGP